MKMGGFVLLLVATLLCFGSAIGGSTSTSSAAAAAEKYWSTTLPNTPMPYLIQTFLSTPNSADGSKSTNLHVDSRTTEDVTNTNWYQYRDTTYDSSLVLYLREETLKLGNKVTLDFTKHRIINPFLSKQEAQLFPFTTSTSNDVYKYLFGVEPSSMEASMMKKTIQTCEDTPLDGVTRTCVTNLESMIDFSTAQLGTKNVRLLTATFKDQNSNLEEAKKQEYTLVGLEKIKSPTSVACHYLPYAHAVFYCHKVDSTRTYSVALEGQDGVQVNAVAVCHIDTSKWSPGFIAFKVLHVKPGSIPVCHFLTRVNLAWAPK